MRTWLSIAVVIGMIPALASGPRSLESYLGRWEGTARSARGEQPMTLTLEQNEGSLQGHLRGPRGNLPLQDIEIHEDGITARVEIEGPGGTVSLSYEFSVVGTTLTGTGTLTFSGQTLPFDYRLQRASEAAEAGPDRPREGRRRRPSVPQPRQEQKLEYFEGRWSFEWMGRDSVLGPGGPIRGQVVFSPVFEGQILQGTITASTEEGTFEGRTYLSFDSDTKVVTLFEQRMAGFPTLALGDWSSPLSIRYRLPELEHEGTRLQFRKTWTIVAPHSFTVLEEFSKNGESFRRLGKGVYTRIQAGADGSLVPD